jgi:hypothetical protein
MLKCVPTLTLGPIVATLTLGHVDCLVPRKNATDRNGWALKVFFILHIVVEWLGFLLHTWEVVGYVLRPETSYPDRFFFLVFCSSFSHML